MADHGFGVQYWRNDSARAVGQFARGLIGMALGSVVDEVKSKVPASRAKEDAEKELAGGAKVEANTFSEDPVLVVELHATLTADYRGLQVAAVAQSFSRSQPATPRYALLFWSNGSQAAAHSCAGSAEQIAPPIAAGRDERSIRQRDGRRSVRRFDDVRARRPERHLLPGRSVQGVADAAAGAQALS